MISLSDEQKENFAAWIRGWDDRINTHDDQHTRDILKNKTKRGWSIINSLLIESDQKAMLKARGNLIPGTNEANEKEVLAMFENQKKKWYQEMQNVRDDLTYIEYTMDHIYELKNRKTYENINLRAENAKLRIELQKLQNEQSK